jgi:hypothetical protein
VLQVLGRTDHPHGLVIRADHLYLLPLPLYSYTANIKCPHAAFALVKEMKRKTSIAIDPKVWSDFTVFVVRKTGSSRKVSEEVQKALLEYIEKHKAEVGKAS